MALHSERKNDFTRLSILFLILASTSHIFSKPIVLQTGGNTQIGEKRENFVDGNSILYSSGKAENSGTTTATSTTEENGSSTLTASWTAITTVAETTTDSSDYKDYESSTWTIGTTRARGDDSTMWTTLDGSTTTETYDSTTWINGTTTTTRGDDSTIWTTFDGSTIIYDSTTWTTPVDTSTTGTEMYDSTVRTISDYFATLTQAYDSITWTATDFTTKTQIEDFTGLIKDANLMITALEFPNGGELSNKISNSSLEVFSENKIRVFV